uniref:Uncharacterized protein n=1 Tax=Meloidogyne enterolobii TaxID=390850 RepID=A0A6V7VV69_MELEN|nr:unnamed protein product [Meloidogyne enterolobii]
MQNSTHLDVSRYQNTADESLALERMVRHQSLWNFIYDYKNLKIEDGLDDDSELIACENDKENVSPSIN